MATNEQADHEPTRAAGAPETLTFASGRYLATRLLGEGAQKRVYLGRDTQLHRDVAIAVIKAEGIDEAALDRVRREAQTIASLGSQPNVITIFDVGEEDRRPYTICEYAPGGALRQELHRADGPLPLARALTIAQDLCQGLALAHAHGILHRDVKPENIWFTSAGTAKLGDFGLAVAFGQSRMTAPGTVLGTAAYMPPEQALGAEVDARGDLYSLGCVLYEMVTGQPPFPDGDTIAVVSQHINSAPSAPSWHNKDVPPSLDALIVRLLAKTPGERPASALSVLEELSAIASASAAGPDRETAVVTLLFCDVVGSTELLTALGDDATDEVRRALSAALQREAREHRGTVVKSAGDGLMVSFRISAANAVACAIAMQRAAGQVERGGARVGLELRVGISSDEASHEGGDWFGTPVVEAARLEAAARPGQILVSEVVRSIVGTRGGARFRPAGKRELKGFARPVSVVEVVWKDDSTPPPVKRKAARPKRRTLIAAAALVLVVGAAIAFALNWDRVTTGPPATGTGVVSVDGHELIVPNGWVLEHWSASPDGAYAVVKTSGSARSGGGEQTGKIPTGKTAVSVYRVDRDGLVEVARTIVTGGDISISNDLSADSSGTRTIRLETGSLGSSGTLPTLADLATIAIDASGNVSTSVPADTKIDDKRIDDPFATITVLPTLSTAFAEPPFVNPSGDAGLVVPKFYPQVSVPAGVAPAGWRVSDAIWSPDGKHLAVTTRGVPVEPRIVGGGTGTFGDDQTQLSVYSVQGHQLRELWREVNSEVEIDHDLAFRDLVGDGVPEVVYLTSDGTNSQLQRATLALRIKDERTASDVPFQLPIPQSVPEKPVDLKGDGKFEWIALDASWEGAGPFSHASMPTSSFVLAWDGHEYVDATARFPDAVLQGPDPLPPPADASCLDVTEQSESSPGVQPYLSRAVSRFLDYFNAGRSGDAQRILNDLLTAKLDPAASNIRDAIVDALSQNPHVPNVRTVQGCRYP